MLRSLLAAALFFPLAATAQDAPPAPPAPPAPLTVAAPPAPPAPPAPLAAATPPAPPTAPTPPAPPPPRPAPEPPAPPAPLAPPAPPAPLAPPAAPADVQAVASAVEDYLLAFYDAEPARLERSLHPDLQKVGFWRDRDGRYHYAEMNYRQALDLAASWNTDGGRTDADSPRAIQILEVNDQSAVAKLTAEWGIDYFHLGKYDGQWKIINVIWQSHPPAGE